MWIITRAINQYDQDGDYFFTAYLNKPTKEELKVHFSSDEYTEHLLKGGGRINKEDEWYYLTEISPGEEYHDKYYQSKFM